MFDIIQICIVRYRLSYNSFYLKYLCVCVCVCVCACMHVCTCTCAKSLQSCSTLCDPMDCDCNCQAPLFMGGSRQEYLGVLPHPPPEDLPHPGIKPVSLTSPALAVGLFSTSTTWEAPKFYIESIYSS